VVWDADSGQSIRTLRADQTYSWEVPPQVWSIAVSADGTRVVSGSADSTVKVWNDETGELLRICAATPTWSRRSRTFERQGDCFREQDGTVRIWDTATWQLVMTLTDHAGPLLSVAVSPDGKRIAAAGSGNAVFVWNAVTGQLIRKLATESDIVDSVAFSTNGKRILAGGSNGNCRLGRRQRTAPAVLTGHKGGVRGLAFLTRRRPPRLRERRQDGRRLVGELESAHGLLRRG